MGHVTAVDNFDVANCYFLHFYFFTKVPTAFIKYPYIPLCDTFAKRGDHLMTRQSTRTKKPKF
jgi:hypothetical protein